MPKRKHFSKVHIANTLFEEELGGGKASLFPPLAEGPKMALQLQFLPALYAKKGEAIVAYGTPLGEFPCAAEILSPEEEYSAEEVDIWGYTAPIERYLQEKRLPFRTLDLEVVQRVNSKGFCPVFSGEWKEPFVAKAPWGFSGRGNKLLLPGEKAPEGFIVEPWKKRLLDFSSQWDVTDEGVRFLGWTLLLNNAHGSYLGTRVDPDFSRDRGAAEAIVKKAQEAGYRGAAGVDAFDYLEGEEVVERSVLELNARRTMARCVLDRGAACEVRFCAAKQARVPLLPSGILLPSGREITFAKQLNLLL